MRNVHLRFPSLAQKRCLLEHLDGNSYNIGSTGVLFFVIWKATVTENWNSYLLTIHVIGNSLSGFWKKLSVMLWSNGGSWLKLPAIFRAENSENI